MKKKVAEKKKDPVNKGIKEDKESATKFEEI